MDLKSQINNLAGLQKIDSEIYRLKAEGETKPSEIQALEAAFENKKQGLAAIETSVLDLQKQIKEK